MAVLAANIYSMKNGCKALDVNTRECTEDVLIQTPGNKNNWKDLRTARLVC